MGVGRTSGRDVTLTGHATVLLVSNVRQATEYYRDALGFEVKLYDRIPDDYRYAERDGCHIHLACFPAVARPNSEAVPPDMFDAYFWVDGIEALHAELVERSRSRRVRPRLRGADLERAGLDVIEPGRATARGARDDKCHGEVRTFATTGSPRRDLA